MTDADGGVSVLFAQPRGRQWEDDRSRVFDGAVMRAWIERSHAALAAARDELDALNVFPVPDSDTGTNLFLTMSEGRAALAELPHDATLGEVAQAVADGALMGARGNSGIILSQYLRAVGATFAEQTEVEGGLWASALDRAALSAAEAMAEPVEGTALTVVAAASDAARRAAFLARGRAETPVAEVVRAAAEASHAALALTPSLLAPLAERGVVDAGGAGFVLLLQALADTVTGSTIHVPVVLTAPGGPRGAVDGAAESDASGECIADSHGHEHHLEHYQAGDYEVMYVLSASEEAADDLRARLGQIGASVGVVGGVAPSQPRGLWHVHVHTNDPVLAVAAARGERIRQVCVRYLRGARPSADALGLVACTRAPGLIAPLAAAGAVVVFVDAGDPGVRSGIARAVVDSGRKRVGILPCGPRTAAAALEVVGSFTARGSELQVEVLESRGEAAVVAGVAGLAGAGSAQDAVALVSGGVARTRTGLVAWPGRPGAADVAALMQAAVTGARDLVRPGDEVLTVVTGQGVPRAVVDALAAAASGVAPDIEVIELEGGQVSPAFALGVE